MAGPLLSIMSQMGGIAFGSQLGQALGRLSVNLSVYRHRSTAGAQGGDAILLGAVESLPPDSSSRAANSDVPGRNEARASPPVQAHVPGWPVQLLGAVEALRHGHEDRYDRNRSWPAISIGVAGRSRRHGTAA